jgi:hypothetical protein
MRAFVIHDLPDWQVTSYGNGLAYEILHKPDLASLFFQGEDAETFRNAFQALTEASPYLSFADALRVIFQDYGSFA